MFGVVICDKRQLCLSAFQSARWCLRLGEHILSLLPSFVGSMSQLFELLGASQDDLALPMVTEALLG